MAYLKKIECKVCDSRASFELLGRDGSSHGFFCRRDGGVFEKELRDDEDEADEMVRRAKIRDAEREEMEYKYGQHHRDARVWEAT